MWKAVMKAYLCFSKRERAGIFILIILMLTVSQTSVIISCFYRTPVTDTAAFRVAVQVFEGQFHAPEAPVAAPLFYFDPNSLPAEDWEQLGVSARTAATIQKYLQKGGHFRRPEDLERIYGLSAITCARLIPFVRIKEEGHRRQDKWEKYDNGGYRRRDTVYRRGEVFRRDSFAYRYHRKGPAQVIDINLADTLQWRSLPGIGAGFARRIVAFRDKLGGYHSIAQVAECYGLPDSTFQKIQPFLKIGDGSLKKIDLNLTDEKSLAAHPYIRAKLAHLIVQYRNAHAGFREVGELLMLPLVDEIIYRKIEPYIEVTF
ncbi:MAG TPA: helix-hairpin-helix domain-containing protein [Chitinophaga sp.]|uniref:helix-hairpin-helix domain-containing protein n=1 Tax=Chitinophaga sp. TaxID=1869181 RepID=UPI002C5D1B85|nr:helix-hairpin-helix domain-containing protein [Chitinophaga sp.]HVI46969.1 helix-hairpin-helix domain-containing protein [Chitinophaga sp.]